MEKSISPGSTMDLRRRFKEYFNVNHLLRNKHLAICAALAKYGYSQFSVEILEYCDPSDILKREQYERLRFTKASIQHFKNSWFIRGI